MCCEVLFHKEISHAVCTPISTNTIITITFITGITASGSDQVLFLDNPLENAMPM